MQCFLLMQYISASPSGSGAEDGADQRAAVEACLQEIVRSAGAAETALDRLADGFELVCVLAAEGLAAANDSHRAGTVTHVVETAVGYATALTSLAAACTNRRKVRNA